MSRFTDIGRHVSLPRDSSEAEHDSGRIFLRRARPRAQRGPSRRRRSASTTPATARCRSASHYHFFEVNKALVFDREKAYGMRLDLPSGTSVRFEPGDTKEVKLIPYGGRRVVYGFNALVSGRLDEPYTRETSLKRCMDQGYGHKPSK